MEWRECTLTRSLLHFLHNKCNKDIHVLSLEIFLYSFLHILNSNLNDFGRHLSLALPLCLCSSSHMLAIFISDKANRVQTICKNHLRIAFFQWKIQIFQSKWGDNRQLTTNSDHKNLMHHYSNWMHLCKDEHLTI